MGESGAIDVLALHKGQRVWVAGRPATFVHVHPAAGQAVVRYEGERVTRVVALRKLRLR